MNKIMLVILFLFVLATLPISNGGKKYIVETKTKLKGMNEAETNIGGNNDKNKLEQNKARCPQFT